MHEMSIALAVIGQIEDVARAEGRSGVETVTLQVGELAGVVPDALGFCFRLACDGTLLAGARLVTRPVPGRARCEPCAREWPTGMPPDLCCSGCGAAAAGLLSGRELQIAAVRWAPGGVPAAAREPQQRTRPTPTVPEES
ncbi:hydrogenase maturation nickel metallochaperone HypA [Streptomyces sp. V4-01]|uniref:Hydrogenase maturation factor HypA n=1 Tax=Actinacidiphila polyblastidii TaxID=3110430 RepID=A0ABU7PDM5_9ACTN|nr:hydrogenase maturation nickel metallochaperone HypA [Streptomyces sp. V4-01]